MEDITALSQRASALRDVADTLSNRYRRATWLRFVLVFFPVPFVVVLLRLQIESWTYILFGAAYLGFSALLYVIDTRASDRCKAADKKAETAQQALEQALSPPAS